MKLLYLQISEDCLPINAAAEEESSSQIDEAEAEVSIGTEIPDQEHIDVGEIHDEETIPWDPCTDGDKDTPHSVNYDNHGERSRVIVLPALRISGIVVVILNLRLLHKLQILVDARGTPWNSGPTQ